MSLFKKHGNSESGGILGELSQRWDMIRTAGSLASSSLIKSAKSKPAPPIDIAKTKVYIPKTESTTPRVSSSVELSQTKPYAVIPQSPELREYAIVKASEVLHKEDDYVTKVHEMADAAEKDTMTPEGKVVGGVLERTIISSEKMPITTPTGLNLVAIQDDLERIYREQDHGTPDIPTE